MDIGAIASNPKTLLMWALTAIVVGVVPYLVKLLRAYLKSLYEKAVKESAKVDMDMLDKVAENLVEEQEVQMLDKGKGKIKFGNVTSEMKRILPGITNSLIVGAAEKAVKNRKVRNKRTH